jgi:outer membrane biosynthesis protein TonB
MAPAQPYESYAPMRGAFIVSGLLHLSVMLIGVVGLPFISKPPPPLNTAISVEIVPVAEITQTNRVAPKPMPKEDEKKPPPPAPEKPQPPKMTAAAPPDATPPMPKVAPSDVPDPKPIKKPDEKKLKSPPKKTPPKKEDAKKPPQEDFDSLLKNLIAPEQGADTPDAQKNSDAAIKGNQAPLGDRMTMSELDALRQQLARCWNVMAGAKFAENLVVEIRVRVSPDRLVQDAVVVDQFRYSTDSYFRAAASSALRALRSPACTPLELPSGKYNEWKDTIITFDPRDML